MRYGGHEQHTHSLARVLSSLHPPFRFLIYNLSEQPLRPVVMSAIPTPTSSSAVEPEPHPQAPDQPVEPAQASGSNTDGEVADVQPNGPPSRSSISIHIYWH